MSDLSKLIPPPVPADERIEHAAEVLARLSEVGALHHWSVTFHRDNAECTGVWPRDEEPGDLADFDVEIPYFLEDRTDFEGSLARQFARCEFAIRQALDRHDFELGVMREVLEDSDARKAVA